MITADKAALSAAVGMAAKVARGSTGTQYGVMLALNDKGVLRVQGTDTICDVLMTLRATGKPCAIRVGSDLSDAISAMPDGPVTITAAERVMVAGGARKAHVGLWPADDFPKRPPIGPDAVRVQIGAREFVGALASVRCGQAAKAEQWWRSTLLEWTTDELRACATDGKVFAIGLCKLAAPATAPGRVGIGHGSAGLFATIADAAASKKKDGPIAITIIAEANRAHLEAPGVRVSVSLPSDAWIDWRATLCPMADMTAPFAVVNRTALLDELKALLMVAQDNLSRVSFTMADGRLKLAAGYGKTRCESSVDFEGPYVESNVILSGKAILDFASACTTQSIGLQVAGSTDSSRVAAAWPVDGRSVDSLATIGTAALLVPHVIETVD